MARRCPQPLRWFIFLLVALFTQVPSSSATVSNATAAAADLPTSPAPPPITPTPPPHFATLATSPARKSPISVTEAVTICRSPAWELQVSNWIFSNAQEWLELYTLRFKDSYEVAQHGLVGSIAYRYLGEPNFRCGVGMTQSCVVWCKDVVMAVGDLEEAKNVYFVLSSIAHFTAVTDLVHSGLEAAQNNVGLMAPKMAYTFYWWKETPDERKRAIILHFTLLGIQNIFQLLSPFLPWVQVMDKLAERLEGYSVELQQAKEHEHIAWLFMRTAHLLNVEWGWTMRNKEGNPLVDQERGYYLHATGLRGDRTDRYWRDDYGSAGNNWWNYQGDEWTPTKRAFWKANELVWRTPRGVGWNALDKYTPDGWRRRIDEQPEQGGNKIPPSHSEYTKLGYWQERTKAFNDLVEWKAQRDQDHSQLKVHASRIGWSVFTGWLPEAFMGVNLWTAQPEGQDRGPEINGANLAMHISKMTSDSRKALQQGFLTMMNPNKIAENGETTLSVTLGRGQYLPANDQVLKSFTAGDIEQRITKNIFHKTLNAALKSQMIYITCTTDIQNRKDPSYASNSRRAVSCKKDNSGPQNLKACVPYTAEEARERGLGDAPGELACYLYKWAARGRASRHHNEAPFGSDEWEHNWGIAAKDIITSSVRAHLMGITDHDISEPLTAGAFGSAAGISDPTTPGVFTVPVCVTRHNWNAPVAAFTLGSELNPHSPSKHLPCSCGYWGDETERVWRDVGLWDLHPEEYRKALCPRQLGTLTSDPLEKFVSNCRLGTKKSAGIRRFGRDSRCRVVSWLLDQLKGKGVGQELSEPLHLAIWCRINKGWWSDLTRCHGVESNTPYSEILTQLDGMAFEPGPDITEEEFWKEIEALDVYDELLLKPFGISNGTRT